MSEVVLKLLAGLPARLFSGAVALLGIVAALYPDRMRDLIAGAVASDDLRIWGLFAVVVAVIYLAIMIWLGRRKVEPPAATPTFIGIQASGNAVVSDNQIIHGGQHVHYAAPAARVFVGAFPSLAGFTFVIREAGRSAEKDALARQLVDALLAAGATALWQPDVQNCNHFVGVRVTPATNRPAVDAADQTLGVLIRAGIRARIEGQMAGWGESPNVLIVIRDLG